MHKIFVMKQLMPFLQINDILETRLVSKDINKSITKVGQQNARTLLKLKNDNINDKEAFNIFTEWRYCKENLSLKKTKIRNKYLKAYSHSSVDFDQSLTKVLQNDDKNKKVFWSSKGSKSEDANEYFIVWGGLDVALNASKLKIEFYKEQDFPENNNYFPAKQVQISVGIYENEQEIKSPVYNVSDVLIYERTISIPIPTKEIFRFLRVDLIGKVGIQLHDNRYYTCIGNLELEGQVLDLKKFKSLRDLIKKTTNSSQNMNPYKNSLVTRFNLNESEVNLLNNQNIDFLSKSIGKILTDVKIKNLNKNNIKTFFDIYFTFQCLRYDYVFLKNSFYTINDKNERLAIIKDFLSMFNEKIGFGTKEESRFFLEEFVYNCVNLEELNNRSKFLAAFDLVILFF